MRSGNAVLLDDLKCREGYSSLVGESAFALRQTGVV